MLRREAEELILPDLPAFLEGEYRPRGNDERLALLGVCRARNLTRAAAGLYSDAFAADAALAEDRRLRHRYKAACAAASAGCGRGADAASLDEAEQARWRGQARQWLRDESAAWVGTLEGGQAADRDWPPGRWAGGKSTGSWPASANQPNWRRSPPRSGECEVLWAEVDNAIRRAPTPSK